MPQVKSFSVGNGDMFYIAHGSDNFTIIDCNLPEDRKGGILAELSVEKKKKGNSRFISTHPDQDHISGLVDLDDILGISNFYCVANSATKSAPTVDFQRYVELRESSKAFYIYKNRSRRWMNKSDATRKTSGLSVLWPDIDDPDFQSALSDAAVGMTPNNISPVIKYSVENGPVMIWMGDLETDFMEKIETKVDLPRTDVLFAPHHGRTSGKVPHAWLQTMDPRVVVIGNAPSEYIHYYSGYNTLTQNSCGDVLFDVDAGATNIYVADAAYSVDYLVDDGLDHKEGLYYIGSLHS
jgi:hypothetical protein